MSEQNCNDGEKDINIYNLDDFEDDSIDSENGSIINTPLKFVSKHNKMSSLNQRLTSAKKIKINELQDRVEELRKKLKEKETEYRLLKKVQIRQEKELSKYENTKLEIPNIFQYHNEEVRVLQNRLKQAKEKLLESENKLKLKETQLQNTKKELQRLQKIVSDNELIEKESLQQMVKSLKLDLEEKELANQNLSRKLELLTKSHRQEMTAEITKLKETTRKLTALEQNQEKLETTVNELRKSKDKQNIYTMSHTRTSSRIAVLKKEETITSAKSQSKTVDDYSFPSSHSSSPQSPLSIASVSPQKTLPQEDILPEKVTRYTPQPEFNSDKKELLLTKLKEMENKPNTVTEFKVEPDFVKITPQKKMNPRPSLINNMPDVSVNPETKLNPQRTSARRKSSLSISSNENLLLEIQKPVTAETVVGNQENKRKNDLMISLFGRPTVQHENDSILDLNQELNGGKKPPSRGRISVDRIF